MPAEDRGDRWLTPVLAEFLPVAGEALRILEDEDSPLARKDGSALDAARVRRELARQILRAPSWAADYVGRSARYASRTSDRLAITR